MNWTKKTLMLFLVGIGLVSCGEEKLPEPSQPTQEPKGEVTFSINSDGGAGTAASPAKVKKGETLNMTISQTSSYTDPNGTVFTCKPEAVIKLSTLDDTLYVKDFKTLTTVEEISKVPSETPSGEKLTKKTLQTFSVGGKEVVVFDMAYDIFNHVNSMQQNIEMPYIKVNSANYGTANADETRASNDPVSVTGIRITPHTPQTRGAIVDSTAYDVNVSFNLELESVNTKEPKKQTLSFEVEFQAVVESTTEYPDPEVRFNYQLQVLSGTNSTASPFFLNLGETMKLQWVGNSEYSYFSLEDRSSKTIRYMPKVQVQIFAPKDTLWVTKPDTLGKFSATDATITEEGTSPLVKQGQKTFNIVGKEIPVKWSYDTYVPINAEGSSVAMPYLELSEPEVVGVNVTELPNARIPGKNAKVYAVEMRLSQKLKSVNAPEIGEEIIEYVIRFTGAMEVKLEKVVYRKDWDWVEPHDNIILNYRAKVHRDRIYSTGETFTDTFIDYGHVAGSNVSGISLNGEVVVENIKFFYNNYTLTDIADSIVILSQSISVPDLSLVKRWTHPRIGGEEYVHNIGSPAGTWDEYQISKIYTGLDISLTGVEIEGADSTSTMPSGWYFYDPTVNNVRRYIYLNSDIILTKLQIQTRVYDQFLVIDGNMINFLEFRDHVQFNFVEENITMPNGAPGLVATYDAQMEFLGRNFYGAVIDTIYQQEPNPSSAHQSIKQNARKPSSFWQKAGAAPTRQSIQLPPPYRALPTFEYGGDPFTH